MLFVINDFVPPLDYQCCKSPTEFKLCPKKPNELFKKATQVKGTLVFDIYQSL